MSSQIALFEEIEMLLRAYAAERDRFAGLPPMSFGSWDEPGLASAEFDSRHTIDHAIRHWLEWSNWQVELTDSTRYWLRCRFEHARFLLGCLLADNGKGQLPCLPISDSGQSLVEGIEEWLLLHSWHHAGYRRWCQDTAEAFAMLRADRAEQSKMN